MNGYKEHPPLGPLLIGLDPYTDLPEDHLARFVDEVVDMFVSPAPKPLVPGQPQRDPRVLIKVLIYSCLTRVYSSRRMAQNCCESLPYLLLVRDDRPCHTALCNMRRSEKKLLKEIFGRSKLLAKELGMPYLGSIAIDSSKFAANASGDSVVCAKDYDKALETFEAILDLVEQTDAKEDSEGTAVRVVTGVSPIHMREVLRSVGKDLDRDLQLSVQMVERVKDGIKTVKAAKAGGLSHVSLTDPDARIMPIGAVKKEGLGFMFEAVTDGGNLLLGETANYASDGGRLLPLFEMAREAEWVPVTQVVADTGYYCGGQVMQLLSNGTKVVVPDHEAAREMKSIPTGPQEPPIEFAKVEGRDAYLCPEGNVLAVRMRKPGSGGQIFTRYVATRECTGCPLFERCMQRQDAKRRNLVIGEFREELKTYNTKFLEPEVRKIYNARGPAIETVFAVIRHIFGFDRWHVRGSQSIESEGALVSCAYQLKKIQVWLAKQGKTLKEAIA